MQLTDINSFQRVSIDTRTLQTGDLFIALRGPNFDGHDFVDEAKSRGAIAAIVEHDVKADIPLIKVVDSFRAFCMLAATRRVEIIATVLAVTGSCGKTTTRALVTSILSQQSSTLSTKENNNNNIGVPLTLLRVMHENEYVVLEIGANQKHEIAFASNIARPDIAIITNAAPVHIAGFDNLDGVANVKGDIIRATTEDGIAILNADDKYFSYWGSLLNGREHLSFGLHSYADITARDVVFAQNGTSSFTLCTPDGEIRVSLVLLGEHNIMNALAASAAAFAVETPLEIIKLGLESVKPISNRMIKKITKNGATIIDDSYNANPRSMLAALRVLAQSPGEKIVVVGDMAELGSESEEHHRQLGIVAKELGIDRLYAQGELTKLTVKSFGVGAQHFLDRLELIDELNKRMHDGVTILIKGSKVNHLWEVVDVLTDEKKN